MSDPKVISFDKPKAVSIVVEHLEELLALAKEGTLRNFVYCGTTVNEDGDRCVKQHNIGFGDQIELLGYIGLMQYQVARGYAE